MANVPELAHDVDFAARNVVRLGARFSAMGMLDTSMGALVGAANGRANGRGVRDVQQGEGDMARISSLVNGLEHVIRNHSVDMLTLLIDGVQTLDKVISTKRATTAATKASAQTTA